MLSALTDRNSVFMRMLSRSMFNGGDPLRSPNSATRWIGRLPEEPVARARAIAQHLVSERTGESPIDVRRLPALLALDARAGRVLRCIQRKYIAAAGRGSPTAQRLSQAAFDLINAFATTYERWLDTAGARVTESSWRAAIAPLAVRLIHYRAQDGKMRAYRFEQWIPGRWKELYEPYLLARTHGLDSTVVGYEGKTVRIPPSTVERELKWAMLVQLVNNGTLPPRTLEWVTRCLRLWSGRLQISDTATAGALVFTPGSEDGLGQRAPSSPRGARYLDLDPLFDAWSARSGGDAHAPEPDTERQGRPALRSSLVARLLPLVNADPSRRFRRGERVKTRVTAQIVMGFPSVQREIGRKRAPGTPVDVAAVEPPPSVLGRGPGTPAARPAAQARSVADSKSAVCEIRDASATGMRVAMPRREATTIVPGELVALRELKSADWRLGIVRRVHKRRSDAFDLGVEVIAEHFARVRLHALDAKPTAVESKDGIEVTDGSGAHCEGIYVQPGTCPLPSIILARDSFRDGREFAMAAPGTLYTLALGRRLAENGSWTWAEVEMRGKTVRPAAGT